MSVHNIRREKMGLTDVYIGRSRQGVGEFGNPIAKGASCPVCSRVHFDAGSTLPCYKRYLWQRLNRDATFCEAVKALYGKRLFCFCKPNPCHGDVLQAAAEWLQKKEGE